jgi:three-Cys-motif partner protein
MMGFYDSPRDQSTVKTRIVEKYFDAWASLMISQIRRSGFRSRDLAYIDLFCGPGRFRDGTKSTPLRILDKAVENDVLKQSLITVFNDKQPRYITNLREEIVKSNRYATLRHIPRLSTIEVGEELVNTVSLLGEIPSLTFIDPWGYKGVTAQIIANWAKGWGCDCIAFFNTNRINAALSNSAVQPHIDGLFGKERAESLRISVETMSPEEREAQILESLAGAISEERINYFLPFRFVAEKKMRTSHHLIFVTKNFTAYKIMKEIMAKESAEWEEGVPTFEYSPATPRQQLLFRLSRPIEDLKDMLLGEFAGETLTMKEVYEKHNVGTRFLKPNYKAALIELEGEGRIATNPPADKRKKETFADHVRVAFRRSSDHGR